MASRDETQKLSDSSARPFGRDVTRPPDVFLRHAMVSLVTSMLTFLSACTYIPFYNGSTDASLKAALIEPPTVVDTPDPVGPGIVRGRIVSAPGEAVDISASSVVIYAERVGKKSSKSVKPADLSATIRREGENFSPSLAVVSVDQKVHFRDDGDLFHRIFSYSEPNAFDLGVAGDGAYHSVVFHHPGLVRFYCSLHGWESGAIFVTPSPHFDRARASGEYELIDLPAGKYRIAAWGEKWRATSIEVDVEAGRSMTVELRVEPVRDVQ